MKKSIILTLISSLILIGCQGKQINKGQETEKTPEREITTNSWETTSISGQSFEERLTERSITMSSEKYIINPSFPLYIDLIGAQEIQHFSGSLTLLTGEATISIQDLNANKTTTQNLITNKPTPIQLDQIDSNTNIVGIIIKAKSKNTAINYTLSINPQ